MKQFLRKQGDTVLFFVLVNLIFLILYRQFIFSDGVYLYHDIGSDSYTSSYPIIAMAGRLLQGGGLSLYELSYTVGMNSGVSLYQYINPMKGFLLLLNPEQLPAGLIVYLWLQVNVTALAGLLYFRLILNDRLSALLPALFWTFSSYSVLWSQNLSFGVCISMFTVTMLFLEKFLRGHSRLSWLLLTGVLALFFITNYYYYYMTGLVAAIYVLIRHLLYRKNKTQMVRQIIREELLLLLSAISSLIMTAAPLTVIVSNFTGSARTGEVTESLSYLGVHHKETLISWIGRFLSTDFFGTGDAYTAAANYYESAVLSLTVLFVTALIYLLLTKRYRFTVTLFLLISAASVVFSFSSRLFTFNPGSSRHLFFIVFLEAIAIGFFVREIVQQRNPGYLNLSLVLGVLVFLLLTFGSSFLGRMQGYTTNYRAVVLLLPFVILYPIVIKIGSGRRLHRLLPIFLLIMASGEMILTNNDSINLRSYFTNDLYEHTFLENGNLLAYEEIQDRDDSLFRIGGATSVTDANDGTIYGYPSVSGYSNTLPASLMELSKSMNVYQDSPNLFLLNYTDYYQYTLLGGKYLLRNGYEQIAEGYEPSIYEMIHRISIPEKGIDKVILENKHALPFGYVYESEISKEDYELLSANEQIHLLTTAFYETDGNSEETEEIEALTHNDDRTPLLQYLTDAGRVDYLEEDSMLTLYPEDDSAVMMFSFDPCEGEDTVQYVHLAIDPNDIEEGIHFVLYPLTESEPDAKETYAKQIELTAEYPEANLLLPDRTIGLRLDVKHNPSKLTAFELLTCTGLTENLDRLKDTDIQNISFTNGNYEATVHLTNAGMLAIPLIYTDEWTAYVNDREVEVHNINGGLVGIPLTDGTSQVRLLYQIPGFVAGRIISRIAVCIYFVLLWRCILPIEVKSRRRHETVETS